MSVLLGPLPETVTIGGRAWPIHWDFRVGVSFELLMGDPDIPDDEKLGRALSLYYPTIPADLDGAVERLLWFYRCGKGPEKGDAGQAKGRKKPPRAYDFDQDADLILAAFWEAYHIDLTEASLHWWKFRALFNALPKECEFCKVMGYRLTDTKGMSKAQKKHYDRMKQVYALRDKRDVKAAITLAERNQRWRDYVDKRFGEMEGSGH